MWEEIKIHFALIVHHMPHMHNVLFILRVYYTHGTQLWGENFNFHCKILVRGGVKTFFMFIVKTPTTGQRYHSTAALFAVK